MQKISSFHQFILELIEYSQFQSPMTRLDTPISDHTPHQFFDQLLIYVNLYQHVKSQVISLICFGDMVD